MHKYIQKIHTKTQINTNIVYLHKLDKEHHKILSTQGNNNNNNNNVNSKKTSLIFHIIM